MRVVAIDPGDGSKTDPQGNGVCVFDFEGNVLERFRCTQEELFEWLSTNRRIHLYLVEEFRYRPGKTKGGSSMKTARTIGAIEFVAFEQGAELIMLTPEAKTMGVYYTGEAPPANHDKSHDVDAYNMGMWWFVNEGICDPPTQRELTATIE